MDRPSTDHGDRPTDHPTDHGPVSIEEAAARLGITPNAVRQRLKRGTLAGHKTPAGWVVIAPTGWPTAADHGWSVGDRSAAWSRPSADRPSDQVDLAPLAELIADLTRENRRLAEAATVWQLRARQAEEKLLALEATVAGDRDAADAPLAAPEAPESTEPAGAIRRSLRLWWRRLLGR